ncbi:MAG: hypothetical protein IPI58_05750 [Alphaproteobacteria bacterium]|nr:MAG: hypothetical protein IPI58_05750 [Alphaproteobacteria bacterium]
MKMETLQTQYGPSLASLLARHLTPSEQAALGPKTLLPYLQARTKIAQNRWQMAVQDACYACETVGKTPARLPDAPCPSATESRVETGLAIATQAIGEILTSLQESSDPVHADIAWLRAAYLECELLYVLVRHMTPAADVMDIFPQDRAATSDQPNAQGHRHLNELLDWAGGAQNLMQASDESLADMCLHMRAEMARLAGEGDSKRDALESLAAPSLEWPVMRRFQS